MIFTGKIERWHQFHAPNPAMLRLQLVQQGYEPFQWSERLGAFYGWHFHEEEQVHWIISGELEITVQNFGRNFSYILKAGDRDFMPPRMYHTARVIGDTDLLYLIGIKKPEQTETEAVKEGIVATEGEKIPFAVRMEAQIRQLEAEEEAAKPKKSRKKTPAAKTAKPKAAKTKTAAKTKKKK